jgi:hypothetical protein
MSDIIELAKKCGIKKSKSRHFMRDGKRFDVYETNEQAIISFADAIRAEAK